MSEPLSDFDSRPASRASDQMDVDDIDEPDADEGSKIGNEVRFGGFETEEPIEKPVLVRFFSISPAKF